MDSINSYLNLYVALHNWVQSVVKIFVFGHDGTEKNNVRYRKLTPSRSKIQYDDGMDYPNKINKEDFKKLISKDGPNYSPENIYENVLKSKYESHYSKYKNMDIILIDKQTVHSLIPLVFSDIRSIVKFERDIGFKKNIFRTTKSMESRLT